jgi:hypothetical protein
LSNNVGGVWNTVSPDVFWTLGAASGLDTALLNQSNDSVSFGVNNGDTFKLFGADFKAVEFVSGTVFTLTVTFSDNSTATAVIVL